MAPARPASLPKTTRPAKHILTIALLSLVACAVGFGSLFVIRNVGKVSHLASGPSASSVLPGLTSTGEDNASSLDSAANQKVISALSSGNPQQALAAMQATGSAAPPELQSAAQPPAAPPTMQSTPPAAAPTLDAGSKGMPDDVRKWLEHLQKIEQTRLSLAAAQLQASVKTLVGLQAGDISHAMDEGGDNVDAEKQKANERAQRVGGDMASMQQAWRTLLSAFDSVPAPAECQSIKSNYDTVIGQTGTMMIDIIGQIKSASNDPQAAVNALTAMQGTSKSRIDVPARASDQGVANVCKHYDVVKWFDIQGDVGSGTMSQLGF